MLTTFLDHASPPSIDSSVDPSTGADARPAVELAIPADADLTALGGDPAPVDIDIAVPRGRQAASEDDPDREPETGPADDVLDIEDSTRLYLREIARVPLLTAEEEVMLAKTMEIGLRITKDPALAVVDLHVWTANNSEPTARAKHPRYALKFADVAARIVRSAIEADDAADLLVTAPRFGFTEAVQAATGEAAELLDRARNMRSVY